MKNKFFIILFTLCFFINASSEEEIIFKASEINILDEGNLVEAKNGSEVILPDNITITSEEFKYNKLDSLLEFNKKILAEDKINDLKLKTEKLEYLKNKKIINTFGKTTFLIPNLMHLATIFKKSCCNLFLSFLSFQNGLNIAIFTKLTV